METYENCFKNEISEFVNSTVNDHILTGMGAKSTEFEDLPDFLKVYYNSEIFEHCESQLIPTFIEKFTLPKEEEWERYLQTNMPLYKQSHKKIAERQFSFSLT